MMSPTKIVLAAAGALLMGLSMTAPAAAYHRQIDDPSSRPLQDWEVFGFDISSVPDDPASLLAFRASLDPRTQLAIDNRCKYDIGTAPNRYSPKIRAFCWGH
jgi:hypothetical protein